jgi:predicted GH43/DUF377 family glycosyl hydrolase
MIVPQIQHWAVDVTNVHSLFYTLGIPVSAALLDLNNPFRVIARRKNPILQPEEPYEKNGDVNNMVFPTGACLLA